MTVNTDYRDVLDIIRRLQAPGQPEFVRWYEALALFYEDFPAMPARDRTQAMDRLCWFIRCGQEEDGGHAPAPLLDWEQDRMAIVADVNKVAGCEIRALPYLHWWTFIAWFERHRRRTTLYAARRPGQAAQRQKAGKMGAGILPGEQSAR